MDTSRGITKPGKALERTLEFSKNGCLDRDKVSNLFESLNHQPLVERTTWLVKRTSIPKNGVTLQELISHTGNQPVLLDPEKVIQRHLALNRRQPGATIAKPMPEIRYLSKSTRSHSYIAALPNNEAKSLVSLDGQNAPINLADRSGRITYQKNGATFTLEWGEKTEEVNGQQHTTPFAIETEKKVTYGKPVICQGSQCYKEYAPSFPKEPITFGLGKLLMATSRITIDHNFPLTFTSSIIAAPQVKICARNHCLRFNTAPTWPVLALLGNSIALEGDRVIIEHGAGLVGHQIHIQARQLVIGWRKNDVTDIRASLSAANLIIEADHLILGRKSEISAEKTHITVKKSLSIFSGSRIVAKEWLWRMTKGAKVRLPSGELPPALQCLKDSLISD